jgi:hypothetical protein
MIPCAPDEDEGGLVTLYGFRDQSLMRIRVSHSAIFGQELCNFIFNSLQHLHSTYFTENSICVYCSILCTSVRTLVYTIFYLYSILFSFFIST